MLLFLFYYFDTSKGNLYCTKQVNMLYAPFGEEKCKIQRIENQMLDTFTCTSLE